MDFKCICNDQNVDMEGCFNGGTNQFQISKAVICCCNDKYDFEDKDDNEENKDDNENKKCTYSVDVTVGTGGDFETLQQMYDWSNTISSYQITVTLVSDLTNDVGVALYVSNGKRYILNGNGHTITQNASDTNYAIAVYNYTYLSLENITIKNMSNITSAICLFVSTNATCRIFNETYPITFINNNQTYSIAITGQRNANILFGHLGTINMLNCKTGVYAIYNSRITMSTGGTINFNNVTTQYIPAKNTLSSDGSFIYA